MSTAPSEPSSFPSSPKVLGLYIHFPFCAYKCGYCDFNSWVEKDIEPQRQWLEGIKKELLFWSELNRNALSNMSIDTLFMGGGTPSLLKEDLWTELCQFLNKKLPLCSDIEWTVEANPETVNQQLLSHLESLGVNRLSLGIQSFKEKYLKRLERGATPKSNRKALEEITTHWKGRWSLDLMFGLPQQSLMEWQEDLTEALSFHPQHVSAYQLTLTTQKAKTWQQGTDSELLDFYRCTRETLLAAGVKPYEISNFSSPGMESRHNLKYWRAEPFLGLGPGAYSLLPPELLENAEYGAHFKTPSRFDEWSRWNQNPHLTHIEKRTEKNHILELLMLGLRLEEGIEKSRFPKSFGWGLLKEFSHLIEEDAERIKATPRGREILDTTLLELSQKTN